MSPLPKIQSPREIPPFALTPNGKSTDSPPLPIHIDGHLTLDPNHLENISDLSIYEDEDPTMPLNRPSQIGGPGHSHVHTHRHEHTHAGPGLMNIQDAPSEIGTHPPNWNTV
jgi:hypothetical protein